MRAVGVLVAVALAVRHAQGEADSHCPDWCKDQSAVGPAVVVRTVRCTAPDERHPLRNLWAGFKDPTSLTPEVCTAVVATGNGNEYETVCREAGVCNVQVKEARSDFKCVCDEPSLPVGWEAKLRDGQGPTDCPMACTLRSHGQETNESCEPQCPAGCEPQEETKTVFKKVSLDSVGYGDFHVKPSACRTLVNSYCLTGECYAHGMRYYCNPHYVCEMAVEYEDSRYVCKCPTRTPGGPNGTTIAPEVTTSGMPSSTTIETTDAPTETTATTTTEVPPQTTAATTDVPGSTEAPAATTTDVPTETTATTTTDAPSSTEVSTASRSTSAGTAPAGTAPPGGESAAEMGTTTVAPQSGDGSAVGWMITLLAGAGALVVALVGAVVLLLRRRRKAEEGKAYLPMADVELADR